MWRRKYVKEILLLCLREYKFDHDSLIEQVTVYFYVIELLLQLLTHVQRDKELVSIYK